MWYCPYSLLKLPIIGEYWVLTIDLRLKYILGIILSTIIKPMYRE